jgi:hypothetical protein
MEKQEMINHHCSSHGFIMIEKNKPCNWCDEFDDIKTTGKAKFPADQESQQSIGLSGFPVKPVSLPLL